MATAMVAALAGAMLAPDAPAGPPADRGSAPAAFAADRVIVRFRPGVGAAERADARADARSTLARALPFRGMQVLRLPPGRPVADAVRALEADPRVEWAEPDYVRRTDVAIAGPRAADLWGLENTGQTVKGVAGTADADIDATAAWDLTQGDDAVTVAVVDTGALLFHPDIAPSLWTNPGESANGLDDDGNGIVDDIHGADWVGDGVDGDPTDADAVADGFSHGTHVASTIAAAADEVGITGVAPGVRVMPLRVFPAGAGFSSDLVAAFGYAAAKGARIVNGSFGGGGPSQAEQAAIAAAGDTLFVFSAGNGGSDRVGDNNDLTPQFPCAYAMANIRCVAATDQHDVRAGFSNVGANTVDLAAPGVNVLGASVAFTTVFADDFESGTDGWTTGGTPDTWALTTEHAVTGSSVTDSPGGDYANDTANHIRSPAFDLTGRTGCRVAFATRYDIEPLFDAVRVRSSADGFATSSVEASWWGSSSGAFDREVVPLTGRDGAPSVRVQFELQSDDQVGADGVHIDDVRAECATPPGQYAGDASEYAFLNGTSMAAPHVAGAAALLASLDPGLTPGAIGARLTATVDPVPGLQVASGGRLNAGRAVRMVPGAVTGAASDVTATTATLHATVAPRGQAASVQFAYGPAGGPPAFQSPAQEVPAGTVPVSVSAQVVGLTPGSAYTFRVVAENPSGIAAGEQLTLSTSGTPSGSTQPPASPAAPPSVAPPPAAGPCPRLSGVARALCLQRQVALRRCAPVRAALRAGCVDREIARQRCAKVRGAARRARCMRREVALLRCARVRPGSARTRCIIAARRVSSPPSVR